MSSSLAEKCRWLRIHLICGGGSGFMAVYCALFAFILPASSSPAYLGNLAAGAIALSFCGTFIILSRTLAQQIREQFVKETYCASWEQQRRRILTVGRN